MLKSHYFLLMAVLGLRGFPVANAQTSAPDQQEKVYVGMYVNRIFDINLKESRFSADFYVWFRWNDDNLNPHTTFQFINGRVDDRQEVRPKQKIGGMNYACLRIVGTVSKFWALQSFPLDSQLLRIGIEDKQSDSRRVVYVVDKENTGINPLLRMPGYDLERANSLPEVRYEEYATNYGDPSVASGQKVKYSQFRFNLHIGRSGYGYYLKLFTGLFVATLIAFLAFFIRANNLDPRFGLGIGAIFAAVASQYVSSSILPDSSLLTLADKLHITAFSFIFISLLESTISLHIFETGKEALSQRMDRRAFWVRCDPKIPCLPNR